SFKRRTRTVEPESRRVVLKFVAQFLIGKLEAMKERVEHITHVKRAAYAIHRIPYPDEMNLGLVTPPVSPEFCHCFTSGLLHIREALSVKRAPKPGSIALTINTVGCGYFRPHAIGGSHQVPVQHPAFRDQTT